MVLLWVALAALAAAVCLPLLFTLRRAPGTRAERAAVDIYRDQLDELSHEVDRGLIGADDASAARNEIARRLIRADASPTAARSGGRRIRDVAAAAIVAMPIGALALYLALGSPSIPDQPLAARLSAPPGSTDVAVLLARVEEHLAANPDDGQGWELVAPVYMSLGRAEDAANAFGKAIQLLGSTADRQVDLGEAIVAVNDGRVTADALAAFAKARSLAPTDPRPQFYIAIGLEQDGKTADAIAAWKALLQGVTQDEGWVAFARAELAKLLGQVSPDVGATPAPGAGAPAAAPRGPTDAEIAAASNLPTDAQAAMIQGMVDNLAKRLATDTGDAQGWAQLVRSYVVLGRPDDARAALVKAKAALAADKDKTAIVEEAAQSVGLN